MDIFPPERGTDVGVDQIFGFQDETGAVGLMSFVLLSASTSQGQLISNE